MLRICETKWNAVSCETGEEHFNFLRRAVIFMWMLSEAKLVKVFNDDFLYLESFWWCPDFNLH